jgi:hypothetical protein
VVSPLPESDERRLAARLDAQMLRTRPASSTEQVLERILAVQAQDPRGARLAVRARSGLAHVSDVDDALTRRRSAVISWLNRGTLHLVAADDYWWLHPLTTPQVRPGNDRRLQELGLRSRDVDRGVEVIVGAVGAHGPQTRTELRAMLDAAGVRTDGQALVHLLVAATLRGHIVRGPVRAGQSAFVGVEAWLGPAPDPLGEDEAMARLARRYLAGHGPAATTDLARWAGITLRRARAGIDAIRGECAQGSDGPDGPQGPDGLVDLADREGTGPGRRMPPPRLLGPFDPVLHGWVDRSPLVGSHRGVVTTNGLFRPTALVGGRVVGTWGLADGRLRLQPLEPIEAARQRALGRDARSLLRFLGLPETAMAVEPVVEPVIEGTP